MGEAVADVGVIMARILHHLIQEVLVVDLWWCILRLWAEGRVLLEELLALISVSYDFLGLEDGDSAFSYVELECGSSLTHRWVAHARPTTWLVSRFRRDIEGKTALLWRNRVEPTIVVIAHLRKVRHCLCVKLGLVIETQGWGLCTRVPLLAWEALIQHEVPLRFVLNARHIDTLSGFVGDLAVFVAGFTQLGLGPGGRESLLVQIATVAPYIECRIIKVVPQGLAKVATIRSSSRRFLLLFYWRLPGANCAVCYEILCCTIRFLIGRSIYIQKTVT